MLREIAQQGQVKVDATIAGTLAAAPWWMQLFDSPTDFILFLIAVAIGLSRLAIMWLEYRRNNSKRRRR